MNPPCFCDLHYHIWVALWHSHRFGRSSRLHACGRLASSALHLSHGPGFAWTRAFGLGHHTFVPSLCLARGSLCLNRPGCGNAEESPGSKIVWSMGIAMCNEAGRGARGTKARRRRGGVTPALSRPRATDTHASMPHACSCAIAFVYARADHKQTRRWLRWRTGRLPKCVRCFLLVLAGFFLTRTTKGRQGTRRSWLQLHPTNRALRPLGVGAALWRPRLA